MYRGHDTETPCQQTLQVRVDLDILEEPHELGLHVGEVEVLAASLELVPGVLLVYEICIAKVACNASGAMMLVMRGWHCKTSHAMTSLARSSLAKVACHPRLAMMPFI